MATDNMIKSLSIYNLKDYNFKIPLYQREYTWGAEEVQILIDDLKRAEGKYYIGNIVADKDDNVIDGQQRLTTLYLMLMVTNKDGLFNLSYEIRDDDNEFLQAKNAENLDKCKNDNMKENLSVIKYNENVLKDCLNKVRLTLTKLPPDTDITRYFELINSRGIQLEKHQILKAKFLNVLKDDKECNWAKIWEYCSNMDCFVEDIAVYRKDEKTIDNVRAKFIDFLKDKEKIPNFFEKEEQNENTSNEKLKPPTILNIINKEDVEKNKSSEISIGSLSVYKSIVNFDYFLLNVLKFTTKKEITMSNSDLLKEFEKLKSEQANDLDKDIIKDFIKDLLKFRLIFDYFIFKRDENENVYFRDMQNESILNTKNSKNLKMIELLFHYTAPNYKAQEWIQYVFRYAYENFTNKNMKFVDYLEKLDNEKAKNHKDRNLDKGTGVAHYWFYRLEYLLWKNFDKYFKDSKLKNIKERYILTRLKSIEHIQPQSKANENNFNETTIHNFGNLALLSSSRNSSLGNLEVNEKKARIDSWLSSDKFSIQSLKMILALNNIDATEWNFNKAKEHGEAMKKLLFSDITPNDTNQE